jgi:hypothetical protein
MWKRVTVWWLFAVVVVVVAYPCRALLHHLHYSKLPRPLYPLLAVNLLFPTTAVYRLLAPCKVAQGEEFDRSLALLLPDDFEYLQRCEARQRNGSMVSKDDILFVL